MVGDFGVLYRSFAKDVFAAKLSNHFQKPLGNPRNSHRRGATSAPPPPIPVAVPAAVPAAPAEEKPLPAALTASERCSVGSGAFWEGSLLPKSEVIWGTKKKSGLVGQNVGNSSVFNRGLTCFGIVHLPTKNLKLLNFVLLGESGTKGWRLYW